MKRQLGLIAFLIGLAMVTLGATELIVRQLEIAPVLYDRPGGFVADPVLPFRPKPNFTGVVSKAEFSYQTHHNSLGFRDDEHTITKPPHTFRVLALGDSFTYGAGAKYEDTFLVVLEKLANHAIASPAKVEIVKMGVSRYFPEVERLLFQHYGSQYKPDLVLVAFVPNDVIDTADGMDAVFVSSDGHLLTREVAMFGSCGYWIFKHSHVGRIILSSLTRSISSMKRPARWDEIYKADGFYEGAWKKIEAEYEKIRILTEQLNAKMVLVHIPHNGDLIGDSRLGYPGQRLGTFARAHGIEFIDTLPPMAKAMGSGNAPMYWTTEGHCTPTGYRLIGETIFEKLVQAKVFP